MSAPIILAFDPHALFRLEQRASEFGLSLEEAEKRATETVLRGNQSSWRHPSQHHITYHHYFADNISFYVICEKNPWPGKQPTHLIHTVIIQRGRE
ncbi:MAG TPA: hypothetical protein VJH22_05315 [Candidatus Nanoarchaeia archaeon]|nr:hypothetical protein [Candidatus Nanoarchaeia archaeon]